MKLANQIEALANNIAAAFWPIIEAAVDALWQILRSLILGLFGGVPREAQGHDAPISDVEGSRPCASTEDRPKWRAAVVRRCLQRRAEGKAPRRRDLAVLPDEACRWVSMIPVDEAADIKALPDAELRNFCERWRLQMPSVPPRLRPGAFGGEGEGAPRPEPPASP